MDDNKILVSEKTPHSTKKSFKYFIEYNNINVIRPLCIKILKMIGFAKCFKDGKTMSYKSIHNRVLKKYIKYGKK